FMERCMSLVDLPGTRQHAAVFIGVGVTQHYFLAPPPRIEKLSIFAIAPYRAAYFGAIAQVFDRLEQGDGHQALEVEAAKVGEPGQREDIFWQRRTTHDIHTQGFRLVLRLYARHIAQVPKYLARITGLVGGSGSKSSHSLRVYSCMLPK